MLDSYNRVHDSYLERYKATGKKIAIDAMRKVVGLRKDGTTLPLSIRVSDLMIRGKRVFRGMIQDLTHERELEEQLLQARKLESLGTLAAGIAHEINTPTQYVSDNITFLSNAFDKLNGLFPEYRQLLQDGSTGQLTSENISLLEEKTKQIKLDFLLREIPKAIDQSKDGVARIATIVRSMQDFSHPGTGEKVAVDLNRAIENTIDVTRSEWKYVAEVVTEFDDTLPRVFCLPAEINQVILIIIVNAAQAIGDVIDERESDKGTIRITTSHANDFVVIQFTDDGPGIPESICERIFDPFFTTKDVGKGTGQGLSLAHSIIVKEHSGSISCNSEEGEGSTFTIRLPIGKADKKDGETI